MNPLITTVTPNKVSFMLNSKKGAAFAIRKKPSTIHISAAPQYINPNVLIL